MGVQHTVTSIGRYIIVGIAIFFGFHMVGLGELVIYVLGALALGVGWILKEPISDFIAYFIILVQRPVKIGDYIRIDENTLVCACVKLRRAPLCYVEKTAQRLLCPIHM